MNYVAATQRTKVQLIMSSLADDHRRRRQMVLEWRPQLRNSCYVFSEANDELFRPETGSGIEAAPANALMPEQD